MLSDEGIVLRMNRSIQADGSVCVLKEDMDFRQFLLRSRVKLGTELLILNMAYNVKNCIIESKTTAVECICTYQKQLN